MTTANSEKENKRDANRKFRRIVKQEIKIGDKSFSELREVSNVWSFDKDGKRYDSNLEEKQMRK